MAAESFDADVVVVGGGLAGLRAAAALDAGGASVLVLEARERVGGRTHTRALGKRAFDFGGQWIGPGQPRIYELVRRLGLESSPTYVAGRKVLELDGRLTTYSGTLPFANPFKLVPLHLIMTWCNRLARAIPADAPWAARRAGALDALSLERWRRPARFAGSDVHRLADSVVRVMFGAEPDEVSVLHFLWYVSSNGGLRPLVETQGGFQQDRIVGGTQQISERMADALGRGRVRLGTAVRAIRQDAAGVTLEAPAGAWRARRAVLAVPLAIAGRIAYEPLLPAARDEIHRRVTMGSTVKVLATYERAFWRERGYSGEAVGTTGAVSVAFDNTTADGAVPCLVGFIAGGPARAFAVTPPERRRSQVLGEFARFYGPEAAHPLEYAEMDWGEEPYSGGCPIANYAPGALAAWGEALRAPAGRIHWAGTESARVCTGYMEGALESGDRAAAEVLAAL